MKKKLMAIVIAASLIGGVGTVTYASVDTVKESILLSNTGDENTNAEMDVYSNESKNETSSKTEDGAVTLKMKGIEFFKFINIKFNNIVVSIQDFFNNVLGNNNSTNDDSNEDSDIENGGQAQNGGQNNDNLDKDNSTEVSPPMNDSANNSQENTEKLPIDKDNSGSNTNGENKTENKTENKNDINNDINVDNTVKPNTPQVPQTEVKPSKPNTSVESNNSMAAVEQMIFSKVNEERAKAGVAALSYNTTMEKYARMKSQDMGNNNYFSHNDLQGNLITVKMKADGVSYRAWGENIAYIGGVNDANALAAQFMTNWMNSQGHRENILSSNFSSIGIGVYKIGNKVYATQEFYR